MHAFANAVVTASFELSCVGWDVLFRPTYSAGNRGQCVSEMRTVSAEIRQRILKVELRPILSRLDVVLERLPHHSGVPPDGVFGGPTIKYLRAGLLTSRCQSHEEMRGIAVATAPL